ncbi:MAG: AAA family ATPase [Pseudomonadota bacterium]
MAHIFISHGPEDLDAVLEVHEAFRRAGMTTKYDVSRSTDRGDRVAADLAIGSSAAVVPLISASAQRSGDVRRDLETAKSAGVPLVPFQIDRSKLTGRFKSEIGPVLKHFRGADGGLDDLVSDARKRYRGRCPVVSVMNLKGGVGKTTLSAQLAGAMQAQSARRVLLIDFDPQYNLTQTFFSMEDADASAAADRSVLSLFEKSRLHQSDAPSPADDWNRLSTEPFAAAPSTQIATPLFDASGPDGRLDLITGQFELSKYAFAHDPDALEAVRQNFLQSIEYYRGGYDLILFDTNPNATFLTQCALEAADRVLTPMHADMYSLRGVRLLHRVIDQHTDREARPQLSVLFNAVSRNEQSDFEADARNGLYDESVGFPLSRALMTAAVPRSGHLQIKRPDDDEPIWRQLLVHHGRGGGLGAIRKSLVSAGNELLEVLAA